MKYKLTNGEHKGKIVIPQQSPRGKNFVMVRLIEGNEDQPEFPIATKYLNPIYEIGSIVSIVGIQGTKYIVLSMGDGWAFLTPTDPKWGIGRFAIPIRNLEPAEDDPIIVGNQVSIIGCPDIIYDVVAIEDKGVKLRISDPESGTFEFILPAAFLQLSS